MTSKSQSTATKAKKTTTKIIFVALLTAATCFPFVIMNNFHMEDMHQQQLPSSSLWQREDVRKFPVDCTQILQNNNTYDPNRGMEKEHTKRLTITDPQFYISLHKEY